MLTRQDSNPCMYPITNWGFYIFDFKLQVNWCPRRDLNPHALSCEPGILSPMRLPIPPRGLLLPDRAGSHINRCTRIWRYVAGQEFPLCLITREETSRSPITFSSLSCILSGLLTISGRSDRNRCPGGSGSAQAECADRLQPPGRSGQRRGKLQP